MRLNRFVAQVALLLLAACARTNTVPDIQGIWVPKSAQFGGGIMPPELFEEGSNLTLTREGYEFASDAGTYSLSGTGPVSLDIHCTEGPMADKTILAIVKLTGNELTICYQLGDGPRPKGFHSPSDTQIMLVRFERAP